jgi:L-aminopeptidase/D-esterase-like protein
MKKLRVWNGDTFIRLESTNKREQMHLVVAAYSKAEAGKIPEYQQAVAQCMAIGRR